jgi:D-3-phosphoglycerate dehydrogenase
MAARQMRDYLEFGQIRNSVNLPEVLLGRAEGVRVLVIHENEPGLISALSSAVGARKININNMISKSRGNNAVTVLEISQMPDQKLLNELNALNGVLRVRTFNEQA